MKNTKKTLTILNLRCKKNEGRGVCQFFWSELNHNNEEDKGKWCRYMQMVAIKRLLVIALASKLKHAVGSVGSRFLVGWRFRHNVCIQGPPWRDLSVLIEIKRPKTMQTSSEREATPPFYLHAILIANNWPLHLCNTTCSKCLARSPLPNSGWSHVQKSNSSDCQARSRVPNFGWIYHQGSNSADYQARSHVPNRGWSHHQKSCSVNC